MTHFLQVCLRTLDVTAAATFYASVLGPRPKPLPMVRLHDHAIARGAKPHWMGFIAVEDVEHAAAFFVARGATLLGPKWQNDAGLEAAPLRDPGGALVALAKQHGAAKPDASTDADVAWVALSTAHVEQAKANYGELTGWCFEAPLALGELGTFHPFAWSAGERAVGSMGDIAGRPEVHPHWLFYFRVAALEPALHAVRALGGTALPPITLPSGARVVACDDPQGAAFGLLSD